MGFFSVLIAFSVGGVCGALGLILLMVFGPFLGAKVLDKLNELDDKKLKFPELGVAKHMPKMKPVKVKQSNLVANANINPAPPEYDPVKALRRKLIIEVVEASGIVASDQGTGKSNPFVKLKLGPQKVKTKTLPKSSNPKWNQTFVLQVDNPQVDVINLTLCDQEKINRDVILGEAVVRLADLVKDDEKTLFVQLSGMAETDSGKTKATGEVKVNLTLIDWETDAPLSTTIKDKKRRPLTLQDIAKTSSPISTPDSRVKSTTRGSQGESSFETIADQFNPSYFQTKKGTRISVGHQGWLEVREEHNWVLRWCVLEGSSLRIHDKQEAEGQELVNVLPLQGSKSVKRKTQKHAFYIYSYSKEQLQTPQSKKKRVQYTFKTKRTEELNTWIKQLEMASHLNDSALATKKGDSDSDSGSDSGTEGSNEKAIHPVTRSKSVQQKIAEQTATRTSSDEMVSNFTKSHSSSANKLGDTNEDDSGDPNPSKPLDASLSKEQEEYLQQQLDLDIGDENDPEAEAPLEDTPTLKRIPDTVKAANLDWLNNAATRVFLQLSTSEIFIHFVKQKINTKMREIPNRPAFLGPMEILTFDFGKKAPKIEKIRAMFTDDGSELVTEAEVAYQGGVSAALSLEFYVNVPKPKSIVIPVVASVKLHSLTGSVYFKLPANLNDRWELCLLSKPQFDLDLKIHVGEKERQVSGLPKFKSLLYNILKKVLTTVLVYPSGITFFLPIPGIKADAIVLSMEKKSKKAQLPPTRGHPMPRFEKERPESIARKYLFTKFVDQALNKGDLSIIHEIVDPVCCVHGTTLVDTVVQGLGGIIKFVTDVRTAFPDIVFYVDDLISGPDTVVCRWSARGEHKGKMWDYPPTQNECLLRGAFMAKFDKSNRKIIEIWSFWNLGSIYSMV